MALYEKGLSGVRGYLYEKKLFELWENMQNLERYEGQVFPFPFGNEWRLFIILKCNSD